MKPALTRIYKAFFYSLDGLKAAWRMEAAFRQELLLCAFLIPAALIVDVSATSRALMIFSVLLVLIVELLNSAIEAAIDRISPELHPLSKRAKDLGSAAVFLALLNAAAMWAVALLY